MSASTKVIQAAAGSGGAEVKGLWVSTMIASESSNPWGSRIHAIDTSDPSNLSVLGTLTDNTTFPSGSFVFPNLTELNFSAVDGLLIGVCFRGDKSQIPSTEQFEGLARFDVTDPTNMTYVDRRGPSGSGASASYGAFSPTQYGELEGAYFFAEASSGDVVFYVRFPPNTVSAKINYDNTYLNQCVTCKYDSKNDLVWTGTGSAATNYVTAYNASTFVSGGNFPSRVGALNLAADNNLGKMLIDYDNDILYVTSGFSSTGRIHSIDISNPSSPTQIQQLTVGHSLSGYDIDFENQILYVADPVNTRIRVYQITNGVFSLIDTLTNANIKYTSVGTAGEDGPEYRMKTQIYLDKENNVLYQSGDRNINSIDVSTPSNITLLDTLTLDSFNVIHGLTGN